MTEIEELLDIIEDLTASLEGALLQFQHSMYPSDKSTRWDAVKRSEEALSRHQLET